VTSQRLDEALVARGLAQSRSRARDAILRGTVSVNDVPARKPSQGVFAGDKIRTEDEAQRFVSRAALKLLHGLAFFNISPKDRIALDLGASTGGFTQVLLEKGATHVIAVDVGHGQMVPHVASNPRVTLYEGMNARDLTNEEVPSTVSLIVADVSFISLRLVLMPTLTLVAAGTELLVLLKPQFEVGRHYVGRGGIVTDMEQHERVCNEVSAFLEAEGWTVKGITPSPMEGGDGNAEFLLAAVKRPHQPFGQLLQRRSDLA
jgi:23S rRNA (cytidine1920-2'-O)/16S rRNA (cytidine1409-2'-O)-methyltransferase